jgi:hypothetical protein
MLGETGFSAIAAGALSAAQAPGRWRPLTPNMRGQALAEQNIRSLLLPS